MLNGWNLWSGSAESDGSVQFYDKQQKELSNVITDTDYADGYKFLEPLWEIKYKFTKQPTAADLSAEVNYPNDVDSYQWYKVAPISEVTSTNEAVSVVNGSDFNITGESSYSSETGWTGISEEFSYDESGEEIASYLNYYYSIDLKAGDTITAEANDELITLVLYIYDKDDEKFDLVHYSNKKNSAEQLSLTVENDGNYIVAIETKKNNTKAKFSLTPAITSGSPVIGSTDKKLAADTAGIYACEVTFKNNYFNTTNPIKIYSDRVTLKDCIITFDANGGTGTMDSVKVTQGSEYEIPTCEFTAPEGKTFDSWELAFDTTSVNVKPEDTHKIDSDITLKAIWKDNKSNKIATPAFSPDGGVFTASSLDVKITCATSGVTIYYTTNGDTPTTASNKYNGRVVINTDTTIKAIAVKDGMESSTVATAYFDRQSSSNSGNNSSSYGGSTTRSYTVKFDTNGGLAITSQYITKNKTVTEPTNVTKYGYTFEGWYTDEEFAAEYDFDTPVTNSFTLYAKWSDDAVLTDNGSSNTADNRIILTIGQYDLYAFGTTSQMDVAPQIVNDRTMLPARFVAEKIGSNVEWNETEPNKVRITKSSIEIIIYIGSDIAYVNGEAVTLDSTAFLENDRTYVPVRFICENLGASVEWNEPEQQVIITVNN